MQCYSALKRSKVASHENTWRKLKCILLLRKRSKSETATHSMIPTRQHSEKGKTTKTAKELVADSMQGAEGMEKWAQRI